MRVLEHVAKLTDRLEIVPAHQGAGQGEKRFMNARTPFVSHVEATKSMQPRQRALDHPPCAPQPAAVRPSAFRQLAGDPAPREFVPMRLRIVSAVALHEPRLSQRPTRTTPSPGHTSTSGRHVS